MRYFNWFIVFPNFCVANVLSFVCKFFLLEMDSGRRILLNRSSPGPLAFCVLGYGILSTNITRILTLEWTIGLAMATTMTCCSAIALPMATTMTLWRFFHEFARQQELQNGLPSLQAGAFFLNNLRLRRWHFVEGPATKSLLALSLRSVRSPCRTAGHRCRHR